MNTRFLEPEFDYVKPATLQDAFSFLKENKNVKVFAGGTDLIVKLKTGGLTAIDFMMDINGIPEMHLFEQTADGGMRIGAGVKLSAIEQNKEIISRYPALSVAISKMASISIRNMGTIGGNFCNASPVADTVGPVICYKGLVELTSAEGTRTVPAEKFFLKPGVSVIRPDELMTAVLLPKPKPDTGAVFIKMGRVASDIAKISLSVVIERDGRKAGDCRMAMGSVAATPLFLEEISAKMTNKEVNSALIDKVSEEIADFIKPITDTRTTKEYRKAMAQLIAEHGIAEAWKQSGGN